MGIGNTVVLRDYLLVSCECLNLIVMDSKFIDFSGVEMYVVRLEL